MAEESIIGVEIDFTIFDGKDLVAKDGGGILGMGKKKSSDPYVVVTMGRDHEKTENRKQLAKTQV